MVDLLRRVARVKPSATTRLHVLPSLALRDRKWKGFVPGVRKPGAWEGARAADRDVTAALAELPEWVVHERAKP